MLKSINFLSSIVTSKPKMVLVLLLAFLGIMSFFINEFKMDASSDSLVLENDEDFKYYREIFFSKKRSFCKPNFI